MKNFPWEISPTHRLELFVGLLVSLNREADPGPGGIFAISLDFFASAGGIEKEGPRC